MFSLICLILGGCSSILFGFRTYKLYNDYNIEFDYFKGWKQIKKSNNYKLIRDYKFLLICLLSIYLFSILMVIFAILF